MMAAHLRLGYFAWASMSMMPRNGLSGLALYGQLRPGIAGLWQVSGCNTTTVLDLVSFDEWYVRNWSLWLDFAILFKTVRVVLMRDGAH